MQLLYLPFLLCCVEDDDDDDNDDDDDDDDDDDGVENKNDKFLKLSPKDFWANVD